MYLIVSISIDGSLSVNIFDSGYRELCLQFKVELQCRTRKSFTSNKK